MKKHLLTISILALLVLAGKPVFAQWSKVTMNDSTPMSRPCIFILGDTIYMGKGDTGFFVYSTAFRGYTTGSKTWWHEPVYPGTAGDLGYTFVINHTAYTGGGANYGYFNDFWKYTPSGGWVSLGTGPGGLDRGYAVAFVINGVGYVGTGNDYTPYNDFWSYDTLSNTWTQVASFPSVRLGCAAFSANGYGYVGLGGDNTGKTYRDMYRYDPVNDVWDTMAPMPSDSGMEEPAYFTLCGKLIVTCGDTVQSGTHTTRQAWLFDPTISPKGKWHRLTNFPGPLPAYSPGGFAFNDTGYVYGGYNTNGPNTYWAHMYRFVPTALNMSMIVTPNDTTICAGSTITLNGSGATSYLWNTTDTTFSINAAPTKDTVYTVSETNGTCMFLDSVKVHVTASPILTITPDPALICSGQSILLTAMGATSYQWVGTSNTTDTLTVSPSKDTTYELLAGNGSCTKDTFIAVHTGGVLNVTINPQSPTICSGQAITLKASGGNSYNWSPSTGLAVTTGDSVVANPSANVTYTVTATDTLGCSGTGYDTLTVVPVPNTPTISQHGDTLVSSASTENQWYLNGVAISGATGQDLIIGKNTGIYTVAVINPADGCTSNSGADTTSGINQLTINNNQLSVYPNPANGIITVKIIASSNDIKDWSLQLTDVLGRTVYTLNSLNLTNEIDLSAFAGGVYFIRVNNKTRQGVFKIVKD